MEKTLKYESLTLLALLTILMAGIIYSGLYIRRERRDAATKADLRALKHNLEMYYNKHNRYPLEFDAGKYEYVVTEKDKKGATGWYVSGSLENKPKPTAAIDLEYNIEWRTTQEGEYHICGGEHDCLSNKDTKQKQ